jgi:hypothetical protein
MLNVNIVLDLFDAVHSANNSFGIPLLQTSVDLAIQIHDMIQRFHPD